jgi:hypothetical protein
VPDPGDCLCDVLEELPGDVTGPVDDVVDGVTEPVGGLLGG